jgi:isopenicillin-N N-acyltransferase-like protein
MGEYRPMLVRNLVISGVLLLIIVGRAAAAEPQKLPAPAAKLRIVVLDGTPYHRGLVHGKTLKEDISALVVRWKENLTHSYKMPADAFIKKFLSHTQYVPAMKKWTPDLIEEVKGIADGAGIDFDTMLVFQWVDEYWVQGGNVAAERCSAMGVGRRGSRPAMIAQNLDIEGFNDGYQVILHIKHHDSDLESFVYTSAGMIGANGMNSHAIGICANTLAQLDNCRDGLPVACIIRGVLAQKTEEAAVRFLHEVKHASGQNYIIGGPDRAYSFECSSHKVSRFIPEGAGDLVWHTNHPLANDDYHPKYLENIRNHKNESKKPTDSEIRLECVRSRALKQAPAFDVDAIKSILKSQDPVEHPVSRPLKDKNGVFTFGSMVMVLSEKPELHVAPGPPNVVPYQVLRFAE